MLYKKFLWTLGKVTTNYRVWFNTAYLYIYRKHYKKYIISHQNQKDLEMFFVCSHISLFSWWRKMTVKGVYCTCHSLQLTRYQHCQVFPKTCKPFYIHGVPWRAHTFSFPTSQLFLTESVGEKEQFIKKRIVSFGKTGFIGKNSLTRLQHQCDLEK